MIRKINERIVQQVIFLLIIIGLFFLISSQLSIFLPSFLGAIILYGITRDFYLYLNEKKGWNKFLATGVIFLISLIIIGLPVYLVIEMTYSKVQTALSYAQNINDSLIQILHNLQVKYGINILSQENIMQATGWMVGLIPKVLNSTMNALIIFFFAFFIYYFMILNVRSLESTLMDWSPLKDKNTIRLGEKMKKMIYSNAIGVPAVALIQGLAALLGYFIVGIDNIWFWFVVTTIAAMLPVVGSALGYVPVAILLYTGGDTWQPIFMILYGIFIIGTVDNVARFTILKKLDDVHPLITVFGVIMGINLFGFIGLIFGPILLSLFFILIKVYSDEFTNSN